MPFLVQSTALSTRSRILLTALQDVNNFPVKIWMYQVDEPKVGPYYILDNVDHMGCEHSFPGSIIVIALPCAVCCKVQSCSENWNWLAVVQAELQKYMEI